MKFVQALAGVPLEELPVIAERCEQAGFSQVAISDHLVRPVRYASTYPYSGRVAMPYDPTLEWPDPWVAAAAVLSCTTTLKVVTDILVLPVRGVLEVASAAATLTRLYGSRLVLGVGLGWMREEFDAAGRHFDGRAKRTEQMVATLRALWRDDVAGTNVEGVAVRAAVGAASTPPILLGGDSPAALRRVGRYGDGWIGMQYDVEEIAAIVRRIRAFRAEAGRADEALYVQTGIATAPTPATCSRLHELGVTAVVTSAFASRSRPPGDLPSRLRAIDRFGDRFIAPLGSQ